MEKVRVRDAEHPGYDLKEVADELGPGRHAKLLMFLADRSVFVCGHRTGEDGHEAHCVYATDLEEFLSQEGANGS